MEIEILNANRSHKKYIIKSNKKIDNVNDNKKMSDLEQNIDKDLFSNIPQFKCLIAQVDNISVGMIIYSYVYWANDGKVLWISQMYVDEKYRKKGVFFKLMKKLKEENSDIKVISFATGNINKRLQKIAEGFGAKQLDLKFYYILNK